MFRRRVKDQNIAEDLIANALVDIDPDYAVSASDLPNRGTGGSGYDLDTNVGTAANRKIHPSGSMVLFGGSGDNSTTPDAAASSITGDIDIRAYVRAEDYTPSGTQTLVAKWASTGPDYAYRLILLATGALSIQWSNDGSTVIQKNSTATLSTSNNTDTWVRVTLDVDNGASGNTVTFYTSTDGVSWTQLGDPVVTAGTTSINDSAAVVCIGARTNGVGDHFIGLIWRAQIYNGIDGTLAVDFDPTKYVSGTTFRSGPKLLSLPGSSGDYLSTPDSAANSITGDIDIRVKVALDDWTPSSSEMLVGKYLTSAGNRCYRMYIAATSGNIGLQTSADGTSSVSGESTSAPSVSDGGEKWVRATLDVDDGSGNRVYKFYTSDDGETWSQLGSTVTSSGTTSILDGDEAVAIGSNSDGSESAAGIIYRAQIYNGIDGTLAVDMNPEDYSSGTTMTSSTTGEVWTEQGNAVLQANYTLNGNSFIQNTGHDVLHSIGSNGLETAADQSITNGFTVFAVGRNAQATLTADSFLIDSRSNSSTRMGIYANDPADVFAAINGAVLDSSVSVDTAPHVFTILANGDTTSKFWVDSTATTGDIGSQNWNFTSILADFNGSQAWIGYFARLLVFNYALSETQVSAIQNYLSSYYGGI